MARTHKAPKPDETPADAMIASRAEPADRVEAMNVLALRMFDGQSDHVPMIQRVQRIKNNLTEKGYGDILAEIVLPHPDYKRYL